RKRKARPTLSFEGRPSPLRSTSAPRAQRVSHHEIVLQAIGLCASKHPESACIDKDQVRRSSRIPASSRSRRRARRRTDKRDAFLFAEPGGGPWRLRSPKL